MSERPSPERVTAVVIGAGQAGLAASHFLGARSIDHVVLERGEVANSWRHERWDSLRMLTPNWQTHLPGQPYDGPDPDGYMTMGEVVAFLDRYAGASGAPVRTGVAVTSVRRADDGYAMTTTRQRSSPRLVVTAYPSSARRTEVTATPFRTGAPEAPAYRSRTATTSPIVM